MKHVRTLILATALTFVVYLCSAASIQAASQPFSTTLTTTYDARQEPTKVTHHIEVTNTQPTQYLARYGISVSSPDIKQVRVTSNDQVIQPEVVATNGLTTIGITFPDQLVGEGKTRTIDISYQHPDATIISGKVLELSIPKVDGAENYAAYTAVLITPTGYGLPTRITPARYTTKVENGAQVTTVPIPHGEGVTALFGTEQLFQLDIEYDLQNPSQNTSLAQITLPPDTNRQTMYYTQIDPPPLSLQTDQDGNWIATYQLPAQTSTTVQAKAVANLQLDTHTLPPQQAPAADLTTEQPFWDISNATIQNKVAGLTNIRAIYDFVVNTLEYDYTQQTTDKPRLTASQALENPTQATCEEFTDLFVTLARAKNVPARRITGYAYTRNQTLRPLAAQENDILHAWPEYFDQAAQEWEPVDPTWEKTTGGVNYFDLFDLNHITLAIQGQSSSLPYPAGSSYNNGPSRKLINVGFTDKVPEIAPNWEISLTPQRIMSVPIPGQYVAAVTNKTGRAWYTVHILSRQTGLADDRVLSTLPVVLPYQTVLVPVTSGATEWMPKHTDLEVFIQHDGQHTTPSANFTIISISPATQIGIAGVAVVGCILIVSLLSGGVLVRRRRR